MIKTENNFRKKQLFKAFGMFVLLLLMGNQAMAQTVPGPTVNVTKGSNTVKVVDNKGTIKYFQSNNGITQITNTTADKTTTTWQLGGTLTAATTIDQNNNNLTFTSGSAKTIINGTLQMNGAVYAKAPRIHAVNTPIVWASDDYLVILQSPYAQNNTVLPIASSNVNRVVGIFNMSGSARPMLAGGAANGIYPSQGFTQGVGGSTAWFISDGTSWWLYSGR